MKIMFHYINKEKGSSPTIVANRIKNLIKENDEFITCDLNQEFSANGFINFKLISTLEKKIKIENPDVIVLGGIASAFHAVIASRKCHIKKIILITHGVDSLNPDRSLIKRIIFRFIIEPLTIILSTDIQCNSCFIYNLSVMKIFAEKKRHLIYNPLPSIEEKKLDKRPKNNSFTIVSASRIIKNKGYDLIVDAIKKINNDNIKFIILGDGDYLDVVKKELNSYNNVSILGKVSNEELLNILSKSNLFMLPSRLEETYGLVYVEAGLLRIPSICGNRGAVKEIINDDNGFILKKYAVDDLVDTIMYAYNNKNIVKQKGNNIYNKIIEINSDDIIKKELIKMYKE